MQPERIEHFTNPARDSMRLNVRIDGNRVTVEGDAFRHINVDYALEANYEYDVPVEKREERWEAHAHLVVTKDKKVVVFVEDGGPATPRFDYDAEGMTHLFPIWSLRLPADAAKIEDGTLVVHAWTERPRKDQGEADGEGNQSA